MAFIIGTNGSRKVVNRNRPWTLAECQASVRGYVEMVPYSTGTVDRVPWLALVNEDGISKGMSYNAKASAMLACEVYGPVLFLREDELE